MKKTTIVLAVLAFFALAAYAGQSSSSTESADQKSASSTANPPLRTIAGKISDDGKTFTADKDGKQWTLKNPEDVKGHEGHHVKVLAHVYMDTNELHVVNVTMINQKAGKKTKATSKPS
jgi:hypothetical protein